MQPYIWMCKSIGICLRLMHSLKQNIGLNIQGRKILHSIPISIFSILAYYCTGVWKYPVILPFPPFLPVLLFLPSFQFLLFISFVLFLFLVSFCWSVPPEFFQSFLSWSWQLYKGWLNLFLNFSQDFNLLELIWRWQSEMMAGEGKPSLEV